MCGLSFFFFFQAEDGIRDHCVTGVQTCALPISKHIYPRLYILVPAGTCVLRRFCVWIPSIFRGPGGVAQLGERLNGIQEVRGSIPLTSTGPEQTAGIAQLVEHNLAKVGVAGSSPVSRSGGYLRASVACGSVRSWLAGRRGPASCAEWGG